MNRFHPISRCLVLMSLLLSMSMASVYPRVAAAECRVEAKEKRGPQVCCCGTKVGRCCGMACCQLPLPNESTPTPLKLSDDRGQPLGLPQHANFGLTAMNAATFRGLVRDADSVGGTSLIALCIRCNT